ncbi:hypothetical protein L6452_29258 [Arctium lappa]|uniref:Uncharacterized protein n=1 Tax=Arctium lappa TaxID=4217 RepID=A0ACB8ZG94_ARCLA|nr:hypothetical protein L6452_29258 [Arctium lappa]
MVFHCRCFSIHEYEYESRARSTTTQTFYSASSDFHPDSQAKASVFSNLPQKTSNLRVFTLAELKAATNNFCRDSKIGKGGVGIVYKGVIKSLEHPFHEIEVAVKYANGELQGHIEWVREVNVLGMVQHPNLVKLVGYCAEDDETSGTQRFLVYEFMSNRSVADHLSTCSKAPLSWSTRLKAAQDAARGLAYLHEGMDFQIIFGDVTSSNILLKDQWIAKLSDLGFARLGPEEGLTLVLNVVRGTVVYAAPEYTKTGHLTSMSLVMARDGDEADPFIKVFALLQKIGIEKIEEVSFAADPDNTWLNRCFAYVELQKKDAQIAYHKLQKTVFGKHCNIKVEWVELLVDPVEEEMHLIFKKVKLGKRQSQKRLQSSEREEARNKGSSSHQDSKKLNNTYTHIHSKSNYSLFYLFFLSINSHLLTSSFFLFKNPFHTSKTRSSHQLNHVPNIRKIQSFASLNCGCFSFSSFH